MSRLSLVSLLRCSCRAMATWTICPSRIKILPVPLTRRKCDRSVRKFSPTRSTRFSMIWREKAKNLKIATKGLNNRNHTSTIWWEQPTMAQDIRVPKRVWPLPQLLSNMRLWCNNNSRWLCQWSSISKTRRMINLAGNLKATTWDLMSLGTWSNRPCLLSCSFTRSKDNPQEVTLLVNHKTTALSIPKEPRRLWGTKRSNSTWNNSFLISRFLSMFNHKLPKT